MGLKEGLLALDGFDAVIEEGELGAEAGFVEGAGVGGSVEFVETGLDGGALGEELVDGGLDRIRGQNHGGWNHGIV